MDFSSLAQTVKILAPGLRYTVGLFAITLVLSLPLGLLLAFAAEKRRGVLATIIRGYVALMRGTPLMLQLFFIYFGLPVLPVIGEYLVMGRFPAACVAFVLNYAAYFSEIFRGGIESVPKGQYEAGQVLGMTKGQIFFKVVLLQVVKKITAPMGNEIITLVKDTSLSSVIAIPEILMRAKDFSMQGLIWPLFYSAVFFLAFCGILTLLFSFIEKKLDYYKG